MAENINVALQTLKHALAVNGQVPTVIPEPALEQQFHGLDLHQLTQLTDAPALAVVSRTRGHDGTEVERFSVDGNDEQRRHFAARQLLLEGEVAANPGGTREVHLRSNGSTGEIFVRDQNDTIYRVTDRQAVIDEELTALLQRRRAADQAEQAAHGPLVVADGQAFLAALGEILHGLSALRLRNAVPVQQLQKLIEETGEPDLESALAAADSGMLLNALQQILVASDQIEQLSNGIAQRVQALLQTPQAAAPAAPSTESATPSASEPASPGQPEDADPTAPRGEPF